MEVLYFIIGMVIYDGIKSFIIGFRETKKLEELSDFLHTLRVNWYVHQRYNMNENNYKIREQQAQTKYIDLSEEDKEKDRKIARKILDLVNPGK